LCFGGTLLPALGFIDVYPFVYSFVADHFQYLACIGPIALVASAGAAVCRRAGQWGRYLGMLTVVAVLMMLGVSIWRQGLIYKDLETLWRDTLAKNPDAWMAHNNLGIILAGQGRVSEAIAEYAAALRIKPGCAEAHNNLALALAGQGKLAGATAEYQAALRIQPDYADAHYNLGVALASQGRISEAITEYAAALRIKPDNVGAHNNLGVALARQGRVSEAIAEYAAALRIKPDYAGAHYNLGVALASQGRVSEATAEYREALRMKPDYSQAQRNLAWLLATLAPPEGGDQARAVTLAQRACELTGNRMATYVDTLAVAYAAAGQFSDAIATAQKAMELARSAGQTQLAGEIEARLQLYRGGRAYRQLQTPVGSQPTDVAGPHSP
jgi:tetratricopeptide (TPR) repeat protein